MKDRINKKNWTLHLSGSDGVGTKFIIELTDDSEYSASTTDQLVLDLISLVVQLGQKVLLELYLDIFILIWVL